MSWIRVLAVLACLHGLAWVQEARRSRPVKHLVFEETMIEGRLGTQQAIVVTSDRRPDFKPMALKLAEDPTDISRMSQSVFEYDLHGDPFPVELSP